MKKFILALIIAGLSLLFLAGCGYTIGDRLEIASNKKLSEKLVTNYIEEKYGFTPTIISTTTEYENTNPIPDPWPSATGYVVVKCKYNFIYFDVVTYAEEGTDKIYDNYEYGEIKEKASETIANTLKINIISTKISYGKSFKDSDGYLIHEKLNTLNELDTDSNFTIVCNVLSSTADITEDNMNELSNLLPVSSNVYIVTYRDKESYYAGITLSPSSLYDSSLSYELLHYELFVKEYLVFLKNKEYNHVEYKLQTIEDNGYTWYLLYPTDRVESLSIEKVDGLQPSDWNGSGFVNAESISNSYRLSIINTDDSDSLSGSDVIIFIPAEQVKNYTSYDIAYQYENDDETVKSKSSVHNIDDYITTNLRQKDNLTIALLVDNQ